MFTRIRLVFACGLLACSTASGQVGIDFRVAADTAGPATVAVILDSDVIDRPLAFQYWQRGFSKDFNAVHPWIQNRRQSEVPMRSGFAVGSDLVISCEVPKDSVELATYDGGKVSGQVVARDDVTGLVAIRVPDANLSGLAISTDTPAAGLPVLIHWMPGGKTVTSEASMIATAPHADQSEIGFTQSLDADFVPPKLGAPVVDAAGSLVGVVVNINGVTTCLPSSHVSRLIESASRDEPADLKRGRLGIQLDESQGSVVTNVADNTPATEAGLQPGDEITKIDDHLCQTHSDVMAAVAMARAGDEVTLEVKRGNDMLELKVKLAAIASRRPTQYLGSVVPGGTQLYQFKDGRLMLMNEDEATDATDLIAPRKMMFGNLQVERSRLEESIKKLEAEKRKQDEMIKRLREEIAEKAPGDADSVRKSIDEDVERLEKIVEEIRERLLSDRPEK